MSELGTSGLRSAFYGDDVTGSVDALLQFARVGWSARLFVGTPDAATLADASHACDVIGVAGIARSLPTDELEGEVRPALEALAALRPRVLQYKACSTADSSPTTGSLGRVLEIGRAVVGDRPVPLLFAQPDFARFTVFGHHFAAEGGAVHRLDRQPTMSRHPSTPMDESDLAVHLRRQTDLPIGGVALTAYTDAAALAAQVTASPDDAIVLDALDDAHLRLIGAALDLLPAPTFAVGSGGLSRAVALAGAATDHALPTRSAAAGPVLAVSGSRSAQTRRQADAAASAGWHVAALPLDTARRPAAVAEVIAALLAGRSVALTSDDADAGDSDVLETVAATAAGIARAAIEEGVTRRLIVCGGDSSSRIVRLLGIESLSIAANPWGNIVLLRAHAHGPADGVELLLKGGQVGTDDLFEQVRLLGA